VTLADEETIMAQQRKMNLDDMSQSIYRGLDTVDDQRASALERLQIVRGVKASSLQREQARLTIKYGEDHPRVKALANRITINQGLRDNVVAETARARTVIPTVDENSWVLHGYVRDETNKGIQGLTVALYDQSNQWVRELGYGCTDQNGYFKIDSTSSLINKGAQVTLHVQDSHGEVLFADKKMLAPAPGQVDYREIVVSDDTQVCAPPVVGRKEPLTSPDSWTVRGRVTDQNGRGIGGLVVNVFDKELIFDDRLGQTETDESGAFGLTYRTKDFRDLIEKKPDLYVKVTNQNGKIIYTLKEAIRYEAGRVEVINIEIVAPKRSSRRR
jgi:hypothetical protein